MEVNGYAVDHEGLRMTPPPVPPLTAAEAAAMVLRQGGVLSSAVQAGDALAAQVAGGMRLSLSQQVQRCLSSVIVIFNVAWHQHHGLV